MVYRVGLAVLGTLAALTIASSANAGCCGGCGGCGGGYAVTVEAPVAYAPPPPPVAYAPPPVAYAPPPVAYAPPPVVLAPAPIAVDHWDTGGWGWNGGCGCGCGCGRSVVYAVAVQPFYVVNQGPVYSGPGLMIPYGTYSPQVGLAVPGEYPYIGRRWYRHRSAYWRHHRLRALD